MSWLYFVAGVEVGNRACDLKDAIVPASREALTDHRLFEQMFTLRVEPAVFSNVFRAHCGIRKDAVAIKSRELTLAGTDHSSANSLGAVPHWTSLSAKFIELYRRNVDVNIDAVEEGAGDLPYVTLYLKRRTFTFPGRAEVAAWARVHRGDECEIGREC